MHFVAVKMVQKIVQCRNDTIDGFLSLLINLLYNAMLAHFPFKIHIKWRVLTKDYLRNWKSVCLD